MGAKTLVSPEEYLSMSFEREPEYVQGKLRERPILNRTHARIVKQLMMIFERLLAKRGYSAEPEVRCVMPNGNFRLPDVALFSSGIPYEEVPSHAPLVAVEVLSNDDRHNELLEKLQDYELWTVPHIWVINPRFRTLEIYESGALKPAEALTILEYGVEIRYTDLVSDI